MVDDEGDGGRAGLRDPEGVPDAGGAKCAAKHPGQRHDEDHIAAEGDDQRGHALAQRRFRKFRHANQQTEKEDMPIIMICTNMIHFPTLFG